MTRFTRKAEWGAALLGMVYGLGCASAPARDVGRQTVELSLTLRDAELCGEGVPLGYRLTNVGAAAVEGCVSEYREVLVGGHSTTVRTSSHETCDHDFVLAPGASYEWAEPFEAPGCLGDALPDLQESSPWLRCGAQSLSVVLGTVVRVHFEERLLRERFGVEFDEYAAAVPAFLPRLGAPGRRTRQ